MNRSKQPLEPARLGESRYEILLRIAAGGMGTVYLARKRGAGGFSRLLAVKKPHPHLAEDPSIRALLIVEARLASLLHHVNVVAVTDVEEVEGELWLVMEYVEGTALASLVKHAAHSQQPIPPGIALRIVLDTAAGLHAAHEARNEEGQPLELVHRDVSPHNVLVGIDGTAKLTDFGIAKALAQHSGMKTETGMLKGKSGYMPPEYVRDGAFDRRSDEFALAVVTWEALSGAHLFREGDEYRTMMKLMAGSVPSLSRVLGEQADEIDHILARALSADPAGRYPTVREFASALELAAMASGLLAEHGDVAEYVQACVGDELRERRASLKGLGDQLSDDVSLSTAAAVVSDEGTGVPTVTPRARAVASSRWVPLVIAIGSALVGGTLVWGFVGRSAGSAGSAVSTSGERESPAASSTGAAVSASAVPTSPRSAPPSEASARVAAGPEEPSVPATKPTGARTKPSASASAKAKPSAAPPSPYATGKPAGLR